MEGADEAFEKFCQDAMFKINVRPPRGMCAGVLPRLTSVPRRGAQILDQRLQDHEHMALQKYAELTQKLSEHGKLQVLHRRR